MMNKNLETYIWSVDSRQSLVTEPALSLSKGHSSLVTNSGFTLIEIMVAIAILGIGIVMVMQLFSGGLRSGGASRDYTRAIIHAKEKMEELFIEPVSGSGEFTEGSVATGNNSFRWHAEVSPHSETPVTTEETALKLLKIKVKVSWSDPNKERSVELVSLKAVLEEEFK